MLLWILFLVPGCFALNFTFPTVYDKKTETYKLDNRIRSDENKTISIVVTEHNPAGLDRTTFPVSVICLKEAKCKVLSYTEEIVLSSANKFNTTLNVTIHGVFLGMSDLQVTVGDESVAFELRILRSSLDHKLTIIFSVFIGLFVLIITFMMGTQLEFARIARICRRPIGPCIGLLCQFGVMPVLGFLIAYYILPDDDISVKLALFAVSTCPGGGKSSFWTIIFEGNLDLSITMTFTQTITALIAMPIWMSTLGSVFSSKDVAIPFQRIVQGLIGVAVPTIAGMAFTYWKPHFMQIIQKWIKRVSWVAMIVISIFAVYTNFYIVYLITWQIVLAGCLLPWSGYLAAMLVSYILRQPWKDCITIAIETGIQNIGIAMLLMMWCLDEPESDISVIIIFVVAIMLDKPLVIIWLVSKIHSKYSKKGKTIDTEDEIDIEKKKAAIEAEKEFQDIGAEKPEA